MPLLKVIDLFAGVGGLSLGAAKAGFQIELAVDLDKNALSSHKKNFPNIKHEELDVAKLTGEQLLTLAAVKAGELGGIIGGPPCQGFSLMGKQDLCDTRNQLFYHFFRLVSEARPAFFLAENVPGLLDHKFNPLRQEAFRPVLDRYTLLEPLTVKASDYGVATTRTRIFFIGYDDKLVKGLVDKLFIPDPKVPNVVVRDALKRLPLKIGYDCRNKTEWRHLRDSDGKSFGEQISDQVPTGIGDELALKKYFSHRLVSGCLATHHTPEVQVRFSQVEQGGWDSISKAPRLDPAGYCPTIRAGTGRDRGSFQAVRPIHPKEDRVITPREAARLQGFPDWFQFHHTKWHSFRQIGNSVSPIVAEQVLSRIFARMR